MELHKRFVDGSTTLLLAQVPTVGESDTLPCLTVLAKGSSKEEAKGGDRVVDVAICWNYLVIATQQAITK